MAVERRKSVDKRFEYAVFGYIHEFEKTWLFNVALLIKHMCLKYYRIREEFTKHGKSIKINESKDIIETCYPSFFGTVYGNIDISTNIAVNEYKWKFKILKYNLKSPAWRDNNHEIYIGIDSSNKSICDDCFSYSGINHNPYFALRSRFGDIRRYDCGRHISYMDKPIIEGDIVEMIIKPNKKILEYNVNGKSYGVAVKDKTLKNNVFHLAICIVGKATKIQLIDFSIN
eukprot:129537_1